MAQCMTDRLESGCFWLYSSASGSAGECWTKTNASLTCAHAKRSAQCAWVGEDEYGMNCVWLEGKATEQVGAWCANKVCVGKFVVLCGVVWCGVCGIGCGCVGGEKMIVEGIMCGWKEK
jgi:hypothetical protein